MEEWERRKVLYRCRRGTRELDEILLDFVGREYGELSSQQREAFGKLLDTEDPLLNEWLCLGIRPADHGMVEIVERILSTRTG